MPPYTFTISRFLVLLAVIVFVLSAFGVAFAGISLVPIGLALFAGSFLVP